MEKKVALITGASDGIGAETARAIKKSGWDVAVIGRNKQKTQAVAREIGAPFYVADFASLAQVATLAEQLLRDYPRIDALANNAGGIFNKQDPTQDGHEITFQVNHLAHYLLTRLMMDRLIKSNAMVINTSSIAHRLMGNWFNINDLDMRNFSSVHLAYGNAKLANILFTRELHRRFHDKGISTAAFHPGVVATSFAKDVRSPMHYVYNTAIKNMPGIKTPAQGAETLVWLLLGQAGTDWMSGEYYADRKLAPVSRKGGDAQLAKALWEKSEELCKAFLPEQQAV